MRSKTRIAAAGMPLAILMAGCGGGGGGTGPVRPVEPPAPPPEPPPAATRFVDATADSGIRYEHGYLNPPELIDPEEFGGGVAAGDYDGDGFVDLFVVRGDIGPNLLYRNLGDNVFENVAMEAGVAYTKSASENYRHCGPAFADMDGDGDLDLFVGGLEWDPSFVFANEGDGTFTDVTPDSGISAIGARHTVSAGFGDYDLDGDLDMFLTHWGTEDGPGLRLHTEHLWRNDTANGDIRFTDVSLEAGISTDIFRDEAVRSAYGDGFDYTFTATFARINEDRYPDLLIAADFLTSMYYLNNGDGTFRNATDRSVIQDRNGMGSAVGDYDADGDLDWFVTSIWSLPDEQGDQLFELGNRLYQNTGGEFSDVTELAGVEDGGWGWAACFADFDNDGDLDIYHTNGWWIPFAPNFFHRDESRFFESIGNGEFLEKSRDVGLADTERGYAIVCADFDNDGDTDIFQAHRNTANAGTLWRNDTTRRRYLKVELNGLPPNTEAAGARIRVTTAGQTQLREIMIGSNFTSQNPTVQAFGLDGADEVDTVEVEWPDGELTTRRDVAADQTLRLDHPGL
ncbi:MAG: CRTAC1 family protein [Gammaproteobacteria bacterium]|nr:CRTAC1 family protein [Gammaproteobacteria bacterium]